MRVYHVRNVNEALPVVLTALRYGHEVAESRNGPVVRFDCPVATVYANPMERVLFSVVRNANPFFHFFESLWMLAGQNDVAFLTQFVKRMSDYSDDGRTFHGAYGARWRWHFGRDQVAAVIATLIADPSSRRAVISMWDPIADQVAVVRGGKDVPCNTTIYFNIVGGQLNMTVCCRSNDLLWGAYGANAVHMSMLQEYVARFVGVDVGTYTQISNDLHVYSNVLDVFSDDALTLIQDCGTSDYYNKAFPLVPRPLFGPGEGGAWYEDLRAFFNGNTKKLTTPYFRTVAVPMLNAWYHRRNLEKAHSYAEWIEAEDWRLACRTWLNRNIKEKV